MGTVSRVHTFSSGAILTAAQLNNEFDNLLTSSAINGGLDATNLGVTAGQATASKALVVDSSRNLADGTAGNRINNLALSGTFESTGLITATAGITSGSNIVSDTDSTDDLGTTGVRWRNLYVDDVTVTNNVSIGGTLTLTGGLTLNGNVAIGDSASDTLTVNSTITSNLIFTDATYDIGASGATRPRDLHLSRNALMGGTLGVTGLLTATAGVTSGSNIVSDTDSTDDLGTTSVRWANLYVDSIGDTGQALAITAGSNNVNVTAGTLALTGAQTISSTLGVTGLITASGGVSGTTGTFSGDLAVDTDTLFVDVSEDRVGINTASPTKALSVVGDAVFDGPTQTISSAGAGRVGATLNLDSNYSFETGYSQNGTVSGTDYLGAVLFNTADTSGNGVGVGAAIRSAVIDKNGRYSLDFHTTGYSGSEGDDALRMRINYDGRAGINETSPSTLLHVTEGGEPPAEGMLILEANSSSRQLRIQPPTDADNGFFDARGGNMTFLDDGTEIFRYNASTISTSSGISVGLGAVPNSNWTTGNATLQVGAQGGIWSPVTADTTTAMSLSHNGYFNGSAWVYIHTGAYAAQYYQYQGGHYFRSAASGTAGGTITYSNVLTVLNDGRTGIGTVSPRYNLAVKGDNTTAVGIALDNDSGSGTLDITALGASYGAHGAAAGEIWFYSPDNINIGGATGNTNDIKFLGAGAEIARFTSDGDLLIGEASDQIARVYATTSTVGDYAYIGVTTGADRGPLSFSNTSASLNDIMLTLTATRAATTSYDFARFNSGAGSDVEFLFEGNGDAYADGSWNGSGADYQEYFESITGDAAEVGRAIVLDGDRVRYYNADTDSTDDIMGVTRPQADNKNSAVVGNVAWNHWTDKYLTDDWGVYLREDVTVWTHINEKGEDFAVYERDELAKDPNWTPPEGATSSTESVRKLNPDYDESLKEGYQSRKDRDEWWLIGLLGQIQVKAGEPVNPRWIKMKNISDAVELYYVR